MIATIGNDLMRQLEYFSGMNLRSANPFHFTPLDEARYYILQDKDQEGFELRFINEDIGMR